MFDKLFARLERGFSKNVQASCRAHHCVQEVSSLVAAGDWRNAYETLAIENRQNPDQTLERAMIDILLQARDAGGAVEISSPGDSPLPFKGSSETGVIPEVAVNELSPDKLREAIHDHGYLLVRGLITAASSAELRNTIDLSMRARMEIAAAEASKLANGPWYYESPYFPGNHASFSAQVSKSSHGPTGSIMVADSPRGAFQVLEHYRALKMNTLLAEYFGEPAVIAARKWVFRVVSPGKMGGGWHQDGQFMGAGARALNMWVALTACGDTTAAPGIALIPKRIHEILEYGTRGAKINWVVGGELVDELAAEAPVVKPYFAAGDALFFDHLSVHRTGHGKDQDQPRHALESWFYAASGNAGNFVMPLY
jgi:hypothetical protein